MMTTQATVIETLTAAEHSVVLLGPIARGAYLLNGQDTARYLQGRVTQDIKALKPFEAAESLLLTPQGRVLGQLLIANLGDRYFVLSDPLPHAEQRSELLRSLLLFKVADDVQSDDLSDRLIALTLVGPHAAKLLSQLFGATFETRPVAPKLSLLIAEGCYIIQRPFGDFESFDIVVPDAQLDPLLERLHAAEPQLLRGDLECYDAIRITAGLPQMISDITEKLVGADLPLERTVAFRKGCYAGQEVIEMATARGRPNRRLVAIRVSGPIPPNAELMVDDTGERKTVGAITSSFYLPEQDETRALAFIKNSVAEDAPLFAGAHALLSCKPGR